MGLGTLSLVHLLPWCLLTALPLQPAVATTGVHPSEDAPIPGTLVAYDWTGVTQAPEPSGVGRLSAVFCYLVAKPELLVGFGWQQQWA